MPTELDLDRAARSPEARQALVDAVIRGDQIAQETDWIEWKGRVDLLEWGPLIAKHILGFANRDPARAARVLEGCGYLLLGVESVTVHGVQPVDSADLTKSVRRYVGGAAGPQWDADYVDVDGKKVLVITVSAPRPGDPSYPLRREFTGQIAGDRIQMPEGRVYVRHPGETREATAADIDMLSARARGIARRLDLSVVHASTPLPVARPIDDSDGGRVLWLNAERTRLLGSGARQLDRGIRIGARTMAYLRDDRSDQEFETEVLTYLREATERWLPKLRARAVAMRLAPLRLAIENPTDENYPEVEVLLNITGDVAPFWTAEMAERRADFPEAPLALGAGGVLASIRGIVPRALPDRRQWGWIDNAGAAAVRYLPEDLRPEDRRVLPTVWLAIGASHAGRAVTVQWSATSTAVSGRLSGDLELPVSADVLRTPELMAERVDADEDD